MLWKKDYVNLRISSKQIQKDMKATFFIYSLIACLLVGTPMIVSAQLKLDRYVIASTGNDTTVGSLSISYTVGELAAIATVKSLNGRLVLTQGFQQHDDVLLNIDEELKIILDYTIAPNPFQRFVQVKLSTDKPIELELAVYNLLGQETPIPAQRKKVAGTWETEFDLERVPEGYYMLALKNKDGAVLRTFSIQKID